MIPELPFPFPEKSACGVGFVASRKNMPSHHILSQGLDALACVEHRGACAADGVSGDGAGIMTDIPFDLIGAEPGRVAVAALFAPRSKERLRIALKVFEETFSFYGLHVEEYRKVPINPDVLGIQARSNLPTILHAIIRRPDHCTTDSSFDELLHTAKQMTRTREKEAGISKEFFFTSLSPKTLVYKALTRSEDLVRFYGDLRNKAYKTRFVLFHRRFSTNTVSTWDKVQPFRLIAHNGEINTIAGNRSWALSRERAGGIRKDELLTHDGISDSGSVNEMVEALRYRSHIPYMEDVMAIMMPPAQVSSEYYEFWSRSMEPWDGPAFITYSDGEAIGARLDRNGFRPCRWIISEDHFYLSSEAGIFDRGSEPVLQKGTIGAGNGVTMDLENGKIFFRDPSESRENYDAKFDARLVPIDRTYSGMTDLSEEQEKLFWYSQEDQSRILFPMIETGKEPIGSMGDTARLAVFSDQPRPLYDFFYQHFAQVTNPPLDYLREKMVTDLSIHLGPKPNIFAQKELIPPPVGITMESPVLTLDQMDFLHRLAISEDSPYRVRSKTVDCTWSPELGVSGFRQALVHLREQVDLAIEEDVSILILSDRSATKEMLPIPGLLALRTVVNHLNATGKRLRTSIVMETGGVRSTHQLACLIGFGASAVCPYLAIATAKNATHPKLKHLEPEQRERNLIHALEQGLLKIMAKAGISVVRSYQTSKLFTAVGLHEELISEFFPGLHSPIGGLTLRQIIERQVRHTFDLLGEPSLPNLYLFKEHAKGMKGERHGMTISRSRQIHKLARKGSMQLDDWNLFESYLTSYDDEASNPLNLRDLLDYETSENQVEVDEASHILKTFGSGAMSFGAISAEAQRDIILAMKEIGGRSNSGEGGENPYYYSEGVSASVKQIASGRFGVTAQYLIAGDEIQIKVAQGAKPGEGGQLMAAKVNEDIAFARFADPGIDLISPPPLHDIYSIEDLKELIYELKQLHTTGKVSVKLVAGTNIGTIAVGVAKAGADVIQISGWDGGTGAASLSSMKHTGLPWEIGLSEVHQALSVNKLRDKVILRVDGGLHTGRDIVMAALLGAQQFDFGKLLLVSEGCIMARICEKNTCPTGIATHDPKYKAKYKGNKDDIVTIMKYLAEDVRRHLAKLGHTSLQSIIGRSDLLRPRASMLDAIDFLNLDLKLFFPDANPKAPESAPSAVTEFNALNREIVEAAAPALHKRQQVNHVFYIRSTDRAVLSSLAGRIAQLKDQARKQGKKEPEFGDINLFFKGSAGQGFAAFSSAPVTARLEGEANDSVAKSLSGGKIIINPEGEATERHGDDAIIGNVALYGATGGTLYVHGRAGDRFCVRNSGATAVVEGIGLHGCEYMTRGTVVILGSTSFNFGAGMTGGRAFLLDCIPSRINEEFLGVSEISVQEASKLKEILEDYFRETASRRAGQLLEHWNSAIARFSMYVPRSEVAKPDQQIASSVE